MDAAIAKIILSQTMTTDNGSSRSQGEVHERVGDTVTESDADLICESFNNSVVRWLTDWNFPGAAYPKVWRKLESDPDVGILADTDTKLQGLGISLKPEAIASRYGDDYLIPERDDSPQLSGEQTTALINIVSSAKAGGWSPELVTGLINSALPVLTETAVAAITSNLGDAAGAETGDVPDPNLDGVEDESESEDDDSENEFAEQPDPIEPILAQLKPIGDATFTEWFTTIQGLMQESDNLAEFRDKLTDAYPDLDAESFKQAMLDSSIIAGMKGYSDAKGGRLD
jgi:phage gp29-like protein